MADSSTLLPAEFIVVFMRQAIGFIVFRMRRVALCGAHSQSHETPDKEGVKNAVLPIRTSRKIKFLAAFRNPADVLRSLYPFFFQP